MARNLKTARDTAGEAPQSKADTKARKTFHVGREALRELYALQARLRGEAIAATGRSGKTVSDLVEEGIWLVVRKNAKS